MAYFANGSEGELLQAQCDECPLGEKPCPVALVQVMHNYDQCTNEKLKAAMNLLIDEHGICRLRPLLIAADPQVPTPKYRRDTGAQP
jgi:hypothetical protein